MPDAPPSLFSSPALPTSDVLIGQVIDNRYRILQRIGEGGVGAVYRGEHVGMGKPVAIKVLHALFAAQPDFRKRFEREARAASKLSHPACVSVLDFGEWSGQLYLVMEFAQGKLLSERLDEGRMPLGEALAVARGITVALVHAHGLGIVHRDLKPSNIMLLDAGATGLPCKLLDFGLAKNMGADAGEPLTQLGTVFGTPSYISPEQAQGQPADARSDLYSFGIVFFEMLAGRKPFVEPEPIELLRAHIHTPPPPLRTLSPTMPREVEALVDRLLAKPPAARIQSAEELQAAIARLGHARESVATAATQLATPAQKASAAATHEEEEGDPTVKTAASRRGAPAPVQVRPKRVLMGTAVAAALFALAAGLVHFTTPSRARSAAAARGPWEPAPPWHPSPSAPAAPPPATRALPAPRATSSPPVPAASAARHVVAAHNFIRGRLWCPNGFEEYRAAIHLDSAVASRSETVEDAIHCLVNSKHARRQAINFLTDYVGRAAEPQLHQVVAQSRSFEVRDAAREALVGIRMREQGR